MSINSGYSSDCPDCNARVRVTANYCERCGYHLESDRVPDHEIDRASLLERAKRQLVDELGTATGFMYAQIDKNGKITVRYSLDEDLFNDPALVFDALIHAIEHPEDPLDLDDVERILKGDATEEGVREEQS